MKRIVTLAVAGLLVASVPAQAGNPDEALGTLLGAAGGGLLGAQIGKGPGKAAATVAGAALGAAIGNSVARDAGRDPSYVRNRHHRDRYDPYYPPYPPAYTYVQPAPVYVEPAPVFVDSRSCRQVPEQVYVNGWPRTVYRTACRYSDGVWRIVR